MGVDVTAWAVVGKEFRSKQDVVEFLESRGYEVDDDLDEQDFDCYEVRCVDGYARHSSYILGQWLFSSPSPIHTANAIKEYALDFEETFGVPAEFIVTEHWW